MTRRQDFIASGIIIGLALVWCFPVSCRDDAAARLQTGSGNPSDARTTPDDWTWVRTSRVEGGAESKVKP